MIQTSRAAFRGAIEQKVNIKKLKMGVKPVIKSPVPKSRAKWKRKSWKKPKTTTTATTVTTAVTTTATSAGLAATTSTARPLKVTESLVTKPMVTKSTKPHNCTTLASHTHDGQSDPGKLPIFNESSMMTHFKW